MVTFLTHSGCIREEGLLLTSVCRNLCNEKPRAVLWGPVLYLLPGEERFPVESMDFFSCPWSWGSWLSRIFMCFSWSRRKCEGSWSLPPPKHIASFPLSPHWPPMKSAQPGSWHWGSIPASPLSKAASKGSAPVHQRFAVKRRRRIS